MPPKRKRKAPEAGDEEVEVNGITPATAASSRPKRATSETTKQTAEKTTKGMAYMPTKKKTKDTERAKSATSSNPTAKKKQDTSPANHQNESKRETQYWLMKAEPDTRIENGIDVSYPIDKLAAATEPEPWDGVRNYVARNHMRSMHKGDLAFFYHSNCKVPGIVGVMRIVEEASVDESAFDPKHPYYDEKSSRDKPRWDCVKVEFVKKFDEIVPLQELKGTPELAEMQIAQKAYGRLSVQAVKPEEWRFILKRVNEPEDLGRS